MTKSKTPQVALRPLPQEYRGLGVIGDVHLASRNLGFRRDDYPRAMLGKLGWTLTYCRDHELLPVVLGDWFEYPRENANWLLVELIDLLLPHRVMTIAGNHDCSENALRPDDSLSVLAAANAVTLLDQSGPVSFQSPEGWVVLGGTSWGQKPPENLPHVDDCGAGETSEKKQVFTAWITHHDWQFEEYGRGMKLHEIPSVDVLINGHIHRRLKPEIFGQTTYLNPGAISRASRSEASRERVPSLLIIRPNTEKNNDAKFETEYVTIPHEPFDDVMMLADTAQDEGAFSGSVFVKGLAELEASRTATGAGLMEFLDQNLEQFSDDVRSEIHELAEEVLRHE
jgi:hypothetical protein